MVGGAGMTRRGFLTALGGAALVGAMPSPPVQATVATPETAAAGSGGARRLIIGRGMMIDLDRGAIILDPAIRPQPSS
jgi:hypothetical protein